MLAFSVLMPVTFAILGVLAILLFSYRQTIKAYPSAGGAYIVTKDNFGLLTAQLAGVALLTDYVLTVSVSVAAGVAAITSAAPGLFGYRVWLSVVFIWLIAWGNLRGVRESGRLFAVPTYFFIVMMFVCSAPVWRGRSREPASPAAPLPTSWTRRRDRSVPHPARVRVGRRRRHRRRRRSRMACGLQTPEWLNARTTLMWMGSLLGVCSWGFSFSR